MFGYETGTSAESLVIAPKPIRRPLFLDKRVSRPACSPEETYIEVATRCLQSLCSAAGFSAAQREAAVLVLVDLLEPWGHECIGTQPRGDSDINDDCFPIEFSVAFEDGVPEVRVLFEAQAPVFRPAELWRAGWEVCHKLERFHGVALDRLHLIADLFEPSDPSAFYAMWHGVSFSPSGPPRFKVYLNPLAQGAEQAPSVICETLARLGFASAIQDVFADCVEGELRFFSLDLSSAPEARAKVYRVHYNSTREEVEAWLRCVPSFSCELVEEFWRTIAGPTQHFTRRPVSTYLSLDSRDQHPSTGTIHFPVRSYADDDLDVRERVRAFLTGDDLELYERMIEAFARRPLTAGVGLHSYVSIRLHSGARRATVYLSPEAYRIAPPRFSHSSQRRVAS